MKSKILISFVFVVTFLFLGVTVAYAQVLQGGDSKMVQGKKQTKKLQPAQVTYYSPMVINSTLTVNKVAYFPSGIHIGKTTGEGGVTFINGTIVNASAGDKPVRIGDDLRVDGRILRYNKGKIAPVQIRSGLYIQGDVYGYNDLITFDDTVKIKSGRKLTLSGVTIEGLSVNNSQIANDAVTTEKIKAGTIVGSDISSSADLNVKDIELSGNAKQSYDKYGLVKAVAYVNSTGGVLRSWNPGSQESISVTHTAGSGLYQLNFHWDVSGRYFQTTPVATTILTNAQANFNSNSQIIDVYTFVSGSAAESGFIITIY